MPFNEAFRAFLRTAGPGCRLRFAPTPSGYLHPGNALNFALNWLVARHCGGRILLRIDDLDAERKRPEYVRDVFESLMWLGLDWDEGPGIYDLQYATYVPEHTSLGLRVAAACDDFEKNWSQHRRLPLYFNALKNLRDTGLLFACRKSRRDLASYGGGYPPEFRDQNLSLDDPDVAWRIQTPQGFPMPDFIVRRRDGLPAYQIASLADDVHFGVTHVIRGGDLEASTQAQRFLAECLGESGFLHIRFLHHPLLTNELGEKLSKSAGASSLRAMREQGEGPMEVYRKTAALVGYATIGVDSASDLLNILQ
ncbi:MAG: hypothetical protein DYG98_10590 [Haliscomenobacteraceae bacterium CHB4]|nr:Glutamate--tRNA ligase [Saprospiraceae bacterium]MCE7923496.1 hypothetical protein [Haliscomenobacteraceae bacterium CHB4]